MALTERYVRADAAGGGDGTTDANSGANGAFTLAEAITDVNTPRVGYRYNIKAGSYSGLSTIAITGDGTATSPNVFRGFSTTPGDATIGRASGGLVDTSNMPTLTFNASNYLNSGGGLYTIFEALQIAGNNNDRILRMAEGCTAYGCVVTNNSTGASTIGIEAEGSNTKVIGCDVFMPSSTGGIGIQAAGVVHGNRIELNAGTGINVLNSTNPIVNNTIVGGTVGINKATTTAKFFAIGNTIVNTSSHGIQIVTGSTADIVIVGNYLTTIGGWAIEFNTSTCVKIVTNNRYRDVTSGYVNGGGDWFSGSDWAVVGDGGETDSDDYTNAAGGDYSLKSGAAGTNGNVSYLLNIGANGTPAGGGSSGGGLRLVGTGGLVG